jgi:D-alanine-D-alanine ligase
MLRDKMIGILMGGVSAEREISLASGEAVYKALCKRGYNVQRLLVDNDVDEVLRQAEVGVVFNALHGRYGEDGCVQGLLELRGIPYTGSGVLASALAMNKFKAKDLFRLYNLPTPPYYVLRREQMLDLGEIHDAFGFPVVVKPAGEGSSVGVSIARDMRELRRACGKAFSLDQTILVERYIPGQEVHVGILNGRALGAIGIIPHNDFFDYESKYTAGHAHFQMPARLSPQRYRGVLNQALRAHEALGCTGATRVDMIVSDLGNEYILEINTLPGLTAQSVLPRIASHAGVGYEDLVVEVLENAKLHTAVRTSVVSLDPEEKNVTNERAASA